MKTSIKTFITIMFIATICLAVYFYGSTTSSNGTVNNTDSVSSQMQDKSSSSQPKKTEPKFLLDSSGMMKLNPAYVDTSNFK